ncbi:flavin-containing monooxygenase [Phenylobacterium parvum]|uniref:NAD(P)/FAD-dependent oxidoreductase n=1 Tax=Phenylobacterium parvum TaxID=2201350 RepID=A0A2Z3HTP9_9CAUL|nr:NAD(P)/FAD-dependent oxidoreductase [Phenylobacterium parvum]AWM77556.1 NAD(P)/FAD-dependent oxidoreductase [Phenylobacterium parvum]
MSDIDLTQLDRALAAAHQPALQAALVHLTGQDHWLRPEWTPAYVPLSRGDTGVPEAEQQKFLAEAKVALVEWFTNGRGRTHQPSAAALRRMMSFVAGAEIPEGYADFLVDELSLGETNTKTPVWDSPRLKDSAARMHVLVIGAGMSGLLTGIRLSQAGVSYEIVDKNPDVGGTWFENTYPGCRVDSSNHIYSYSFEPNHHWPQHFSTQPILLDYFRGVADRYDLRGKIAFETEVETLDWDESRALWKVTVKDRAGARRVIEANAVITAVGQLNRPRMPDIKGRDRFAGPAFHSARWRHDVDLTGKRVAVIGTGASAYQFVPEIAGKVGSLTIIQRTPPWGFPVPHYHEDVPDGMNWLMEHVPYYDKWYRFWMFWMVTDGLLPMVQADPGWNGPQTAVSAANLEFREMIAAAIAAQAPTRPDLVEKVVPTYPVGGKRSLLDNGVWMAALQRDNVSLVTDGITEITEAGIVTADGTARDFDVIIYGTGFHASKFLEPMKIRGRGAADLHATWDGDPRAYLGMTTPGFPNLFMIYGPNTNIVVNGSIIFFSECSVRYIVGCLKMLAETGARAMEPKREVHDAFNARVDAANGLMAWGAPQVSSWYKNEKGRVTQNWPFALVDYWRATLAPDPGDFRIEKAAEPVA